MKKILCILFSMAALVSAATVDVYDSSIVENSEVTWETGDTIILKERVFVESGAILTIEEGVIVKAEKKNQANTVMLVISRGAKIYAVGTKANPIIFTSVDDTLPSPVGTRTSYDGMFGLWGGIAILGSAPANTAKGTTENILGLNYIADDRWHFGGETKDDTSGIFTYVQIRYGGAALNEEDGVYFPSFILGGVGYGTVLENVEVYHSLSTGFVFSGGTVAAKYLMSSMNGKAAFSMVNGWNGLGQFWASIAASGDVEAGVDDNLDVVVENIGGASLSTEMDVSPVLANMTFTGSGVQTNSVNISRGAAAKYINSIFSHCKSMSIASVGDSSSKSRIQSGDLMFISNTFHDARFERDNPQYSDFAGTDFDIQAHLAMNSNFLTSPTIGDISVKRINAQKFDLRAQADSIILDLHESPDTLDDLDFLELVCYRGAFDPTASPEETWVDGWTALSQLKYLNSNATWIRDSLPNCGLGNRVYEYAKSEYNSTVNLVRTGRSVSFDIRSKSDQQFTLSLYSMQGKLLRSQKATISAGRQHVAVPTNNLSAGSYIADISVNGNRKSFYINIVK